jgi:hypothetical protein
MEEMEGGGKPSLPAPLRAPSSLPAFRVPRGAPSRLRAVRAQVFFQCSPETKGKKGKKRGKAEEKIQSRHAPVPSEFVSLSLQKQHRLNQEDDRRAASA